MVPEHIVGFLVNANIFFFNYDHRELSKRPYLWLRRRRPCNRSMGYEHLGNLIMKLACAFMTCSSWISLPFNEGVLLCISNFMICESDNTQFMSDTKGRWQIDDSWSSIPSLLVSSSRPEVIS